MKTHFKKQIDALINVYNTFDDKSSERLVKDCLRAIETGHAIIAGGLGKNVPICEKFVGTLNSLGIRGHFLHINSAIHGDLGLVQNGDVVILLSKSGETIEGIHLNKYLKAKTKKIHLLTCSERSSQGKIVSNVIVLDIKHEGDRWDLVPNNSSIAFLVFLQTLAMELVDKLEIDLTTFKANHPGGNIGKILRKVSIRRI